MLPGRFIYSYYVVMSADSILYNYTFLYLLYIVPILYRFGKFVNTIYLNVWLIGQRTFVDYIILPVKTELKQGLLKT